jgi:hypothetical protein
MPSKATTVVKVCADDTFVPAAKIRNTAAMIFKHRLKYKSSIGIVAVKRRISVKVKCPLRTG